jgi:hypothetical protein
MNAHPLFDANYSDISEGCLAAQRATYVLQTDPDAIGILRAALPRDASEDLRVGFLRHIEKLIQRAA